MIRTYAILDATGLQVGEQEHDSDFAPVLLHGHTAVLTGERAPPPLFSEQTEPPPARAKPKGKAKRRPAPKRPPAPPEVPGDEARTRAGPAAEAAARIQVTDESTS